MTQQQHQHKTVEAIPEGYDKFQVVLSGNEDPKRDQAECSFYIVAEDEAQAAGYAHELMERMGYSEVGISSADEAADRREIGYTDYEFGFPDPEDMILLEAPRWGSRIPEVVLVLRPEEVEDLFDHTERSKRERANRVAAQNERRGRATPLRGKKKNK